MGMFEDEADKFPQETRLLGRVEIRTRQVLPRLKAQREELIARLNKIDSLLVLLEKNPDMVKVIDLSRELL